MRILIGGPAREVTSPMYRSHVQTLQQQTVEVDLLSIQDLSNAGDYIVPNDDSHHWGVTAILRVASMRQAFLDHAAEYDYDAAVMVDTDLLLAPDTIERMLAVPMPTNGPDPIVFGVFWTDGWDDDGPMPQCWEMHPYASRPQFVQALRDRDTMQCFGGGACTLIRRSAFKAARYWPLIGGVPPKWGEDRHFCIRATAAGIPLVAHGDVRIHHAYRGRDRTPDALDAGLAWLRDGDGLLAPSLLAGGG